MFRVPLSYHLILKPRRTFSYLEKAKDKYLEEEFLLETTLEEYKNSEQPYIQQRVEEADAILKAIQERTANASSEERKLHTAILRCTRTALESPFDEDNIIQSNKLINSANEKTPDSKVWGAFKVFIGSCVILGAIVVTACTFGTLSPVGSYMMGAGIGLIGLDCHVSGIKDSMNSRISKLSFLAPERKPLTPEQEEKPSTPEQKEKPSTPEQMGSEIRDRVISDLKKIGLL